MDAVARLHRLTIDDLHPAFGASAVARGGQAFPASTRAAVLGSDAVLVAGAEDPALAEVMAELDLRARVTRVRFGRSHDVAFVAPLAPRAEEWSLEAAFRLAETRGLRLSAVGDGGWHDLADAVAAEHEHVRLEHLSPRVAIPLAAFDAGRFDVVVDRRAVGRGDHRDRRGTGHGARRRARPARRARAEPVHALARGRLRARRQRRREPEQHAARGRDDARARPRRARRRVDPRAARSRPRSSTGRGRRTCSAAGSARRRASSRSRVRRAASSSRSATPSSGRGRREARSG